MKAETVWCYSTHASQEFDVVRMWTDVGLRVTGVFDCFSRQRPRVVGITDSNSIPGRQEAPVVKEGGTGQEEWSDLVEKDRNLETASQDMAGVDVYVLMETVDRAERMAHYGKMGLKTVLQCFGQETDRDDANLVPVLQKYPNTFLACYSKQVVDRYVRKGVPLRQVKYIPFGIYPEDWGDMNDPHGSWAGDIPVVLFACNSIQYRGEGCGFPVFQHVARSLPWVLIGKDTDKIGGFGEQTFNSLRWWYKRAAVFCNLGTMPAPYTMTPVEAMMSGCPIVFYDNGAGIRDEEWAYPFFMTDDLDQLMKHLAKCVDPKIQLREVYESMQGDDPPEKTNTLIQKFLQDVHTIDLNELSMISRKVAMQYFNAHQVKQRWLELFIQ